MSLNLLGLFTGALYKISSQDLIMRDLYTRALYKISSQDLYESLQETSIRIQHAESTERIARTKSKSAPRYSESDPTRTNSAEGCTSQNKKCPRRAPATFHQQNEHGATARAIRHAQSPERVAFANMKSAPRHSETQKISVPTAP